MIARRYGYMLGAAGAILVGCGDDESDTVACDGRDESGKVTLTPDVVELDAGAGDAKITGTAIADVRLAEVRVGGVRAKGTSSNFGTWEVTVPASELKRLGMAGRVELPLAARDVCGDDHSGTAVMVKTAIPAGTPAADLEVTVTPRGDLGCYLPADGSRAADVTVTAAPSAVGVPVVLMAFGGTLVGAATGTLALDADGETSILRAVVTVTPGKKGFVTVSAAAGPSYDLAEELLVAPAPTFRPAELEVADGGRASLFVQGDGALARCSAQVTGASVTLVHGDQVVQLNDEPFELEAASCGFEARIDVERAAEEAPTLVVVRCTDTAGQSAVATVRGATAE